MRMRVYARIIWLLQIKWQSDIECVVGCLCGLGHLSDKWLVLVAYHYLVIDGNLDSDLGS